MFWADVSETVEATFEFDRRQAGRFVRPGRCRPPTRANVKRRPSTRYVWFATERVELLTGWNGFAHYGWLPPSRARLPPGRLPRGRYRVTVTPTDATGARGPKVVVSTTVLRLTKQFIVGTERQAFRTFGRHPG